MLQLHHDFSRHTSSISKNFISMNYTPRKDKVKVTASGNDAGSQRQNPKQIQQRSHAGNESKQNNTTKVLQDFRAERENRVFTLFVCHLCLLFISPSACIMLSSPLLITFLFYLNVFSPLPVTSFCPHPCSLSSSSLSCTWLVISSLFRCVDWICSVFSVCCWCICLGCLHRVFFIRNTFPCLGLFGIFTCL